ncbi:MAG: hypothetical protein WC943_15595 [Elusimicrobiota bacterium]|jgi:hypothetical protein
MHCHNPSTRFTKLFVGLAFAALSMIESPPAASQTLRMGPSKGAGFSPGTAPAAAGRRGFQPAFSGPRTLALAPIAGPGAMPGLPSIEPIQVSAPIPALPPPAAAQAWHAEPAEPVAPPTAQPAQDPAPQPAPDQNLPAIIPEDQPPTAPETSRLATAGQQALDRAREQAAGLMATPDALLTELDGAAAPLGGDPVMRLGRYLEGPDTHEMRPEILRRMVRSMQTTADAAHAEKVLATIEVASHASGDDVLRSMAARALMRGLDMQGIILRDALCDAVMRIALEGGEAVKAEAAALFGSEMKRRGGDLQARIDRLTPPVPALAEGTPTPTPPAVRPALLRRAFDWIMALFHRPPPAPVEPQKTAPAPPPLVLKPFYEVGLVAGLAAAQAVLDSTSDGQGDAAYLFHHFEVRRDLGNAVMMALDSAAVKTENPFLADQLHELANDLRVAPQDGRGYAQYWAGVSEGQQGLFMRVSRRISEILKTINGMPDAAPERSFDSGLTSGLSAAAFVLERETPGRGDTQYWLHHFEVRREAGNAIARVLISLAKTAAHRLLAMQLEEAGKDLLGARQSGHGDAEYWAHAVSEQDRQFKRVSERLRGLAKSLDYPDPQVQEDMAVVNAAFAKMAKTSETRP